MEKLPKILNDAIAQGVWKNPRPDVLRNIFGNDLPDMELFKNTTMMKNVKKHLDIYGYVDDPQFCIVRKIDLSQPHNDPRLVFEYALFLGGSIMPGDDIFIATDLKYKDDPKILLFDWEQVIPNRWIEKGTLQDLLKELKKL